MSDGYWREPLKWNRKAEAAGRRALVFCASMADVFEAHPEPGIRALQDRTRDRLWELIAATPWLTWQLLTKRPGEVAGMVPWGDSWPENVWLGVSVEDQQRADERVPVLLGIPARVRFLSCEPLLESVSLDAWLDPPLLCSAECDGTPTVSRPTCSVACRQLDGTLGTIDWVIVGGESGPKARPMHPDWARSLRDQCVAASVPLLFKQWGEWGPAPWRCDRAEGEDVDAYKARAEKWCATHAVASWGHVVKASHRPWSAERTSLGPEHAPVRKWGKEGSGRELDDQTWDQYPEVVA